MMWLGLLTLHLFGNVGYNLLLRRSVLAKVDRWFLATTLQTGIAIPSLFLMFFYPISFAKYDTFSFFLLISSILATMLFHFLNVKALVYLEASVYSVVYNTRIILTSFLGALFLSEKLTPLQMLGGLLIFSSIFIVRQKEKFFLTRLGFLYGFGSAICVSMLMVTEKMLNQRVGFFEYFIPDTILCAVIMWGIVLLRRTSVSFEHFLKPSQIQLMSLRALSAFGFSGALVFGPVALSNYVASLVVVLTVISGILFLNERDYLKEKIIATIIAFLGLTFVLIGKL